MGNTPLQNIAVFIDFENFGAQDSFNTKQLIDKLKERGRLIVKRAYADWGRFSKAKRHMLENSVELIELPSHTHGKNMADIKLVVDALETAMTREYIGTFVVVSGDSDYTPLISKLREYNKYVIVVAARHKVSALMIGYCDELIYYSSLVGEKVIEESDITLAYDLLVRATNYLENQGIESRSSLVKTYMRQLDATFNESNYGFSQFKRFLEKARQEGLVELKPLEHGDQLVHLLPQKGPERDTVFAPLALKPKGQPSLPYLVYWAVKSHQIGGQTRVTLSEISSTIKTKLYPGFKLCQYGYSKTKGFKAIFEELHEQGLITLEYQADNNQYYITPTAKLAELVSDDPPPSKFEELRYENMSMKRGITTDFGHLRTFMQESYAIFEAAMVNHESFSVSQLVKLCRQRLNTEDVKHPAASNRVIQTILKSGAVKNSAGAPITDLNDTSPIAALDELDIVLANCVALIQQEFVTHFQEQMEASAAEALLHAASTQ